MKHYKLVIFFLFIIIIFIIYKFTFHEKVNYLSIGDSISCGVSPYGDIKDSFSDYFALYLKNNHRLTKYNNKFSSPDLRITDFINQMKENKHIKDNDKLVYINQEIQKADIITLSLGFEELNYKINLEKNKSIDTLNNLYNYVDEIFSDYLKSIEMLRKITLKPIILIGYYNPLSYLNKQDYQKIEKLFRYIEINFNKLAKIKNIYYIGIYDVFKEKSYYIPSNLDYHPSLEGQNYISNELIKLIETKKILK
ncbi:MAG: hypothetical protein RSB41_01850 [Bacilli bacterium]